MIYIECDLSYCLSQTLLDCLNHTLPKSPYQGARSTMKFQVIWRLVRWVWISLDLMILCTYLAVDLYVLALSERRVVDNSHLLVNQSKARRNEMTFKSGTNSKWTAWVLAQVNKHTYVGFHGAGGVIGWMDIEGSCKVYSSMWKGRVIRDSNSW